MQSSLFDLLIAPWKTAVLNTSVRLKVFTILADGAMSAEAIAAKCGAKPAQLKAVLNALVGMELLKAKDGEYRNSHLSAVHLVEGRPHYMGDFVELLINQAPLLDQLHSMVALEQNDQASPEDGERTFIKGMHNLGMMGEAWALVNAVDLSGCRVMADAGGGSGIYSVGLCQKYQELHSVVLDCKEILPFTQELTSPYAERDRIELRECDITTEPLGEDLDAVLLSDVTYDADEARKILSNAWNCLGDDGQLIIRGYYSNPGSTSPLFGALFVINLLAFDSERTMLDYPTLRGIVEECGFEISQAGPLTERSFVITARKVTY